MGPTRILRKGGCIEGRDLVLSKGTTPAQLQIAQDKGADGNPAELENIKAGACAKIAHLAVTTFGDHHF